VSVRGEVIAQGRDCDIVDHGPGVVLRRPRVPRSMAAEAEVMSWLHAEGYPCPEVVDVVDDGLVMPRLAGPSMLDDLASRPHRVRAGATLLADLHNWLHRLTPPDELPLDERYGPGPTLVHGDLHPGNLLLTDDGPVVIDWSNACRGPAGADVAVAWLLLGGADAPVPAWQRPLVVSLRRAFLRWFLAGVDRDAGVACLPAALAVRRADAHLSPAELERMARLTERASRARTPGSSVLEPPSS
jgi:aminoglycoside phosphotransferase (APT) family kinase protein